MWRFVIVGIGMSMAFGCKVGPDYSRPSIETPQEFRYEPKDAAKTADTEWWKQFGDPILDELIAEALANNLNVKIAAANVEQAAGIVTTTQAPMFPQLAYGAGAARTRSSENTGLPMGRNPQTQLNVGAAASWEIDLWGRIARLTESARANLFANEEARRGVILSLVAQVAISYLQLRGLDEQVEVSKRTQEAYAVAVRLFELQFQHGQVSEMIVAQARSQYETASAAIPALERQVVQLENSISVLLGRNPGPIRRGLKISQLTIPTIPSGLPSELLERRPDIRQSEQVLIGANAQIGAAKALYYPNISLTAAFGFASNSLSDLFTGPSRAWSFAGSITGPIFTAGSISGQVAQAEAAQKAAVAAYELSIQNAFADVESALSDRQLLQGQVESEQRRVAAYQDFVRLSKLQYDGGYTPYLTVVFAETQLFPAELSSVQAQTSILQSVVGIYRAMAGGWVDEADKLTNKTP